jgi:hypothetical protein
MEVWRKAEIISNVSLGLYELGIDHKRLRERKCSLETPDSLAGQSGLATVPHFLRLKNNCSDGFQVSTTSAYLSTTASLKRQIFLLCGPEVDAADSTVSYEAPRCLLKTGFLLKNFFLCCSPGQCFKMLIVFVYSRF